MWMASHTRVQGPLLHEAGHGKRLQVCFPTGRSSPQSLLGTERCSSCCCPKPAVCWQLTQRRCHPVWPQEALQVSHSPVAQLQRQNKRFKSSWVKTHVPTMSAMCTLPRWAAGVTVAVTTDGSWFIDVWAEGSWNHLPISLPSAAKPGILFSCRERQWTIWLPWREGEHAVIETACGPDLLHKVWNSGTISSEPIHRIWHLLTEGWTPVKNEDDSGWCIYRTRWPWSRPWNGPDWQEQDV